MMDMRAVFSTDDSSAVKYHGPGDPWYSALLSIEKSVSRTYENCC